MPKKPKKTVEKVKDYLIKNWSTILTFAIIYIFILQFFGVVPFEKSILEIPFLNSLSKNYMLTYTTTTGGDLGSHWVLTHYLGEHLLPTGRLVGWYPHWMGGLPLFQYYFVPPYLLMVLLSPLLSLQVAFKLVSAAWIFFTPIAFYYCAKGLGFKKPGPEIAASLSLALSWLETVTGGNYAQWGGNVKSAMAGQFPYAISLAFAVLSMGMLWHAYTNKKHVVLNAVIFAMVILHHLYTTIAVGLAATFFLIHALRNKKFDGALHLGKIFLLGFLISGFWLVPSFAKLSWSSPPRDVFYGLPSMDWVFIQEYTIFYLIIIFGFSLSLFQYYRKKYNVDKSLLILLAQLAVTFAVTHAINMSFFKHESLAFYFAVGALLITLQTAYLRKEDAILYCLYAFAFIFLQLYISQFTNLLYARFIPLMFALYLLLATKALLNLTNLLKVRTLVPVIIALLLVMWVGVGVDSLLDTIGGEALEYKPGGEYQWYLSHGVKDAPGWLKWNYEGLEVKPAYSGVKELWNYTTHLPLPGRLNYEYYDYSSLATARIFEASPSFTNRSVMEALLVESSTTFPFFYYMQKTVSETSWWPGFPIKIPSVIDLKHGKNIYWVYNVQYYLVYSDTIKKLIKNESDYTYLTTISSPSMGSFEIYSVNEDSHYADVPHREPILVVTDTWRPFSFKWFDVTDLDVPVVFKSNVDDYDLDHFNIIVLNKTLDFEPRADTKLYTQDEFLEAVNASPVMDYDCGLTEEYSGELLEVDYNCVGKPLWVKIPMFPNWKTPDAERIYFASPSLMLVYPESGHFMMYYGWVFSDISGYIASFLALIIVLYSVLLNSKRFQAKINKPLLAKFKKSRLNFILKLDDQLAKKLVVFYNKLLAFLWKNKFNIVLVLILLYIGLFALNYNSRASGCSNQCSLAGSDGYSIPTFSNVVDNYEMGSKNERDNILRDLKCTAVCDASRRDYVYVSGGGYVEYTMYVQPNQDNVLSIRAIDNQNCRQNDIYIDGEYIGELYGIGEVGQRTNFDIKLPPVSKPSIRVRLYHNTSKTECYGFDVFSNQIIIPECSCFSGASSAQETEHMIVLLIGGLAFAGIIVIIFLKPKQLSNLQVKTEKNLGKIVKYLMKDKKKIVLIVVAIIAAYFIMQNLEVYMQAQSQCASECQATGFNSGHAPSRTIIDEFRLGGDYSDEYGPRNFVCTAVCDETRKDYVYASGGAYVEFDMEIEPNEANTLVIAAGNFNELCRHNDIYVDNQLVASIEQKTGGIPENEYKIILPKMNKNKVRVRIDHSLSRTECWGHDVFKVRTQLPTCICE